MPGQPGTVLFRMRIADRLHYHSGVDGHQTLQVGDPFEDEVETDLDRGNVDGDDDSDDVTFTGKVVAVNDADQDEDKQWVLADLTATYHYDSAGPYTVEWENCCVLGALKNASSGSSGLRTRAVVDLHGNTASPRFSISPVVGVAADGAVHTIKVPALDADGSVLTYDLLGVLETQQSVPDGLTINPTTGVLSWNTAGRAQGLWMASVRVRDAAGAETWLTFLLDLGGDSQGGSPPVWSADTRGPHRPQPADGADVLPCRPTTLTTTRSRSATSGLPDGLTCTEVVPPPAPGTGRVD